MTDRYDDMALGWIQQTEDKPHGCACLHCRLSLAALLRKVAGPEGVRIFYSEEDKGYIAVDDRLAPLSAWGSNETHALAELMIARVLRQEVEADDE